MQKNRRKDLGKLQKQAINSCNRKQFLTVPKLGEIGLIRKFKSRSSICKKNQRKDHGKQENNSCNIKQFLTVPKLGGFGLIRKFRSRPSICKKNQLKRSYKTQVMIKRNLNMNLNKFRNLKISKS